MKIDNKKAPNLNTFLRTCLFKLAYKAGLIFPIKNITMSQIKAVVKKNFNV